MPDYKHTAAPDSSADAEAQTLADLLEVINSRLERGERVELEALIETHPEHEARLRELMPTILAMASWGREEPDRTPGESEALANAGLTGMLGDFRILGELGRGGMGTVFEAEQLSMGRRVALKVLPFAALANENALKRFRNEVRAAAALDHPHIVAVFSVGEQRGIHYYSMQLIRGQSLAELIHQTRQELLATLENTSAMGGSTGRDRATLRPAKAEEQTLHDEQARISTAVGTRRDTERYRMAARLGVQAAEALQHAHDQGVLHRDIKPGNLMLDKEGKIYVTDFGLARIEADAGMTLTGDIVGTLRYMAPEQVLAKRVVIDHRADIYSLGATLYELLSLQPAFGASERNELLKRIAFDEPTRLKKADCHIPVELETIVHKAIAKSPDERYSTVQELSDDLRAFLDHRPINARRPTLLQVVGKWSRRNVGIVWSILATAALVAVATLISLGLLWEEQRRTHQAAAESKAVVDFLVNDLLAAPAETQRQGRELTVSEVLYNAETRLDDAFDSQPLVEATVRLALATTYLRLRDYEKAQVHARNGAMLRESKLGPFDDKTCDAREMLLESLVRGGKFGEARPLAEAARANAARQVGHLHPSSIRSTNDLAFVLLDRNPSREDLELAERLVDEALTKSSQVNGPGHRETIRAKHMKSMYLSRVGRTSEALGMMIETLSEARQLLGVSDPLTQRLTLNSATAYKSEAQLIEAIPLYEELLKTLRVERGEADEETVWTARMLAYALGGLRRFNEGAELCKRYVALCESTLGPDHPTTIAWVEELSHDLRGSRSYEESAQMSGMLIESAKRTKGENHPDVLAHMKYLAFTRLLQTRFADGVAICDRIAEIASEHPSAEAAVELNMSTEYMARCLYGLGQVDEGRRLMTRHVAKTLETRTPDDDYPVLLAVRLAYWALDAGDMESGNYWIDEIEKNLRPGEWHVYNRVAWILATAPFPEVRDGPRAVRLARHACELSGYQHAGSLDTLAAAYAATGDFESAVHWGAKAVALGPPGYVYADRLHLFQNGELWLKEYGPGVNW